MTVVDERSAAAADLRAAPTAAPVGAAVDLGSNSVHLLVAALDAGALQPLVDESAFLGLGGAVDGGSHLGRPATGVLVATLSAFVATARGLGAERITLLGTEPIRRAADAARIVAAVETGTGVPLHVLTHEEEAYLTLVGVTEGHAVEEPTLVLDIGGGSSEFASVAPGAAPRAVGLRIGSNRLANQAHTQDPPGDDDIDRMRAIARTALRSAFDDAPTRVLGVGGTVTNLLKVTSAGTADRRLDRVRLAEALDVLASTPARAVTERYGVNPIRARLLAAGAILVEAILERYQVEAVTVSDAGLREGALLVAARAGRAWRDRLPELARGWRP